MFEDRLLPVVTTWLGVMDITKLKLKSFLRKERMGQEKEKHGERTEARAQTQAGQ